MFGVYRTATGKYLDFDYGIVKIEDKLSKSKLGRLKGMA